MCWEDSSFEGQKHRMAMRMHVPDMQRHSHSFRVWGFFLIQWHPLGYLEVWKGGSTETSHGDRQHW